MIPPVGSPGAAWERHLRAGGTTPWPAWLAGHPAAPGGRDPVPGVELPGAAQLELLRLLNATTVTTVTTVTTATTAPTARPGAGLADHVLTRPGPGRGAVELPLPAPEASRGGSAAPAEEVLRVATGVLADLTARLPVVEEPVPSRPPRGPRPSFVLRGFPDTVAGLRAGLAAAGRPDHRPRLPWFGGQVSDHAEVAVLVLGPVADGLRQGWSRRVQDGSARSWRSYVTACAQRDALPPASAALDLVDRWLERTPGAGAKRVHVVTTDRLAAGVEEVLGVRPTIQRHEIDPYLVEVLRRVNAVLPFVVAGEAGQAARRRSLVALMRDEPLGPALLGVPEESAGWVAAQARAIEDGLRSRGCTLHGDLAVLHAADPADASARPRRRRLVGACVRMIHRVDGAVGPGRPTGPMSSGGGR